MFVTQYFLIGKVSIISSWIALTLSFVIAYSVVRIKYGKEAALLLGDVVFYFILVWKLSVLVTDFKTVVEFPLSIIYFNGGTVGIFLGIGVAALKVFIEMTNNRISNERLISFFIGILIIQSMYQVLVALMNEGSSLIRFVTVVSFTAFTLVLWLFDKQLKEMPMQLILLMIGLHLFISTLQPAGLLQTPMFVALGVGGLMMIALYLKDKFNLEALH